MSEVFDIRAQNEEHNLQHFKEVAEKQNELKRDQVETFRHNENTRLSKIAIVLAAISIIVSLIALFKG